MHNIVHIATDFDKKTIVSQTTYSTALPVHK